MIVFSVCRLLSAYKIFLEVTQHDNETRDKLIRGLIEESNQPRKLHFNDISSNEDTNSILITDGGDLITYTDTIITFKADSDKLTISSDIYDVITLSKDKIIVPNLGVNGNLDVKSNLKIGSQVITKYWQLLAMTDVSGVIDTNTSNLQILYPSPQIQVNKLSMFQDILGGHCTLGNTTELSMTFTKPEGISTIKIEVSLHLYGDWFEKKVFLRKEGVAISSVSQDRSRRDDNSDQMLKVDGLPYPPTLSKRMTAVIPVHNENSITITLADDSQAPVCDVSWGLVGVSIYGRS